MNPRAGSGVPWLGSVPSHWRVLEPRRIFSLRKQVEQAGDVHLTPSQHFGVIPQEEYMEVTGTKVVLNLSGTSMQHVEPGDFISHLRTFQGGLELARTPGKVSPAYTVVSPRPGVDPEYFKYVFKSQGYVSQIASVTDQLRDGQTMRYAEFNRTPLALPLVGEQRAIADYLDHETAEIDAFIRDLVTFTDLTAERTRSHIANLLSERARRGDSHETTLGRVIYIAQGQVDPRLPAFLDWPLIAPNHIESMSGRLLETTSARDQGAESGKYLVKPGQIVYSKIRPALMKATRIDFPALCSADMYAMDANPKWLSNDYLLEYLLAPEFETFAVTMSERVAMPKLNRDTLARAPITIPEQADQREIVSTAVEARRKQFTMLIDASAAIDLARERRAALISAAVTGQIDVTKRHRPVAEVLEGEVRERV